MHEYEVEIIHEPSGAYMNMVVFTDDPTDEVELANIIWSDISVIVLSEKEAADD
jgi:hypothetical protein